MVTFLIVYGTGEGQTAKVADHIAETMTDRGHEATTVNVAELSDDIEIDDFDAILIGASIHVGKHQQIIKDFITAQKALLRTKPTAFFQISLSSATEEGRAQAATYIDEFIQETEWHPDRIGLFGGALRYSEYGFIKRLMMKQIAKRAVSSMPNATSSGDIEFTNWDEVESFAADVAAFVEGRLGVVPPDPR